jgi:hypothetical protein
MHLSAHDVATHYRENIDRADALIERFSALKQRLSARRGEAQAAADAARLELARAYLLELSVEALTRAQGLTGFRGFTRRDPLKAMAHELGVLQKTVARIRADERYQKRNSLVGPYGRITLKLEEARGMMAPWELECQRFESLEGFLELVEIKYDTPEFAGRWWQASYWKHWAAGDRICEALELDDFGDDVLPAYKKVAEPRDRWRAQIAEIEAAVSEIHEMVREHDQALARIPRLPALYLEQCHQVLAEFLAEADLALLEQWRGEDQDPDRAIQMGLRKAAGTRARLEFLRDLEVHAVDGMISDMEQRKAKFARKRAKFQRSKYAYASFGDDALDRSFARKYNKYGQLADQWDALAGRMMDYDGYERFDLENEPELWFRELTGSRPPRQMGMLRSWYDRHPSARPAHDAPRRALEEAAAEAAAWQEEAADLGYIS